MSAWNECVKIASLRSNRKKPLTRNVCTNVMNMHVEWNADFEKYMKKPAALLILALLLICGATHASELSSADERALIHDANIALSQQDYRTAFIKYSTLAEQGNAVAQFNLGVLYLNGQGVQKDDKHAFSWLHKSATQGYTRASQLIKAEASRGNVYAQNELDLLPDSSAVVKDQQHRTLGSASDEKANLVARANDSVDTVAASSKTSSKDIDANKSEKTVSISFGFDHTAGKYGTKQESTSTSIPSIISYGTDNYLAAITVPYLEQTGPAGSILGARRHIVVGSNKILSEKGLGDILGSVTGYVIDNEDSGVSLDVKAKVKFGTADVSKGLGTGKNDYSFEADLYKDFDKSGLSGTLGYTKLGSPGKVVVNGIQQNIVLHNVFYMSFGSTYQFSKATTAGLTINTEQSSENGMPRQEDVTFDLNHKINKANKLDFYLLKGLTNGSPDRGFGASLKSTF